MLYNNPQDNTVSLQRLGNLAYLVMGMRTEGGRTPPPRANMTCYTYSREISE